MLLGHLSSIPLLLSNGNTVHIPLLKAKHDRRSLINHKRCCIASEERVRSSAEVSCCSSANATCTSPVSISRRCALGGIASGLTLLSMPASATERAAGALCLPISGSHDTSIIIMWHALRLKIDLTGAMELERRLEERISEFQLPNGLHFIIMERHNAPIVSVHTYVNVGAFDERHGQTGAPAHLYHPVFQEGTRSDLSC